MVRMEIVAKKTKHGFYLACARYPPDIFQHEIGFNSLFYEAVILTDLFFYFEKPLLYKVVNSTGYDAYINRML